MRSLASTSAVVLLLAACGGGATAGTPAATSGRLEVAETLEFGTVELGERGARTLTLRNAGPGALEVEEIVLPAPFGGGDGVPATLGAGETLEVPVTFAPRCPGLASASARVRAGGQDHEVRLSGTGGDSGIRCGTDPVDLGRPVVGAERSFTITCHHETDRSVEVDLEYEGPPGVTWTPSGPVMLPSGPGSITFDLAYRPAGLAPLEAVFRLVAGDATMAELPILAHPIATAAGPIVGLACPGGLDLGFTPPGTAASRTFLVTNVGDRPLRVTAAVAEGPFTLAPAAPFSIPVDDPTTPEDEGSVEVTVTFAPSAQGAVAGIVRLAFDDPGTPRWSGCVTGFGGGPVLSCTPAALDFGPVASAVPRTETVTCTNTGIEVPNTEADLLHLTPTTVGEGFAVTPASAFLAAGEAVALEVTFAPTEAGASTGLLAIESNDPAAPRLEVPLAAEGLLLGPCHAELATTLDFGPVAIGGTPATLAVSLHNAGEEPCLVRDVALAPTGAAAFSLPNRPVDAAVIAPGDALAVPVAFAPRDPGPATGTLALAISDPAAPLRTVRLSGSTPSVDACLALHPESIDFGEVGPGCASLAAEIWATNRCAQRVTVVGEWVGSLPGAGSGAPADPIVLEPGLSVVVPVEYRPTAAGEHFAGFRWASSTEGPSRLVPIHGKAAAPSGLEVFPPEPAAIDVLFVMDNSANMGPTQDVASRYIGHLLDVADAWNLDWRFGVTTSGLANPCGNPGGAGGAEDGRLFPVDGSRPRFVRPTTPNAVGVAAANLLVGECHFEEQGLEAAYRALTPPVVDHVDDPRHPEPNDGNLGFLRPDARLAVIVAADEPDQSPLSAWSYAAALGRVKREVWRQHRVVGHAVTGDPGTGCLQNGGAMAGDKLFAWSQATGGHFQSICAFDGPDVLADLGLAVFGRHRFALKGRPAGTPRPTSPDLRVFVDGQPWAADEGDWRWDAAANEVVFALGRAPPPTSLVEFRYTPLCVPPAE